MKFCAPVNHVDSDSSSESEDMEVQEVIQIEDSDDESVTQNRRSSLMDSGRRRKIRHHSKFSTSLDKKRQREEEDSDSMETDGLADSVPQASEQPSESKKAKPSDETAMEVESNIQTSLFDWKPTVNLTETEDSIVLAASLPGFGKDDISVDLDEYEKAETPFIKLSAKKTVKRESSLETLSVQFTRLIPVPKSIDSKSISAFWDDGILKISVKKPAEPQQPREPIRIPVADS